MSTNTGRVAGKERVERMLSGLNADRYQHEADPGAPAEPEKQWTDEEIREAHYEALTRDQPGDGYPSGPNSVFYTLEAPDVGEDRPRVRRVRDNTDLLRLAFKREREEGYRQGYEDGLRAARASDD